MEHANIYLCKADCSLLGTISGIKTETCQITKNLTDFWELTFEVERYTDKNGTLVQSSYYDSINTLMKIYFDSNDVQMFFVINTEPAIAGDGYQETKTVTAHSIECELNNMFLKNFKINCGTKDSQEYLATDSNNTAYNINPYTELPYEYISLVNYRDPQLSLMHLALQNTGWTVKTNIDPEICQIKKSFDISSSNIYAFLMETVSPTASVLFEFDRKHKQIGMVKLENSGEDTGIFVTMRNLMNHFEVSGTEDNIITKLTPNGADNLGIEYVNFGKDYIINLDYFMDTINEYSDYKYVSTELHNKYHTWKDYRDNEQSSIGYHFSSGIGSTPQTITLKGTRRELYKELSKLYNQTILDISERKNRVPNDGASIDYKTYSLEELKISLNAYNQALAALITIYKNEYGVTQIGNAPNYTPTPSNAVNIKDTPYWYDFYAYKESIIPKVEQALKMYCQTDENGNLMTDNNGNFIELEFGNPDYYADSGIVKEVDSYKYEWSLYGLDELESKKKAWSEAANLLFDDCFIQSGTITNPTAYRIPNETGWNSLSETQKKRFTSQSAYIEKLNQYLDYMSFNTRDNSLTKTKCKGVIRQCDDAIRKIKNEISLIEQKQDWFSRQRREIANSVTFENFKVNNTLLFTEKDLNVINSMIREDEYTNDNILITSLDDIVTTIDAQEELYQSAIEKLYEISQPQYSFHTELDNIYALDEFQYYQKPFEIGNFIRVSLEIHEEICDNKFIKLRLVSITYNPLESDENLSVEFSTIVKAINGISDLGYFLGKNNSSSGGSTSSGSSSSSDGTYGNNNANVQISNNMLNALLNTELFGTTVTDVILDSLKSNKGNFNTLFSHSGIFDSLEAGRIKISGTCLFDIIKSSNYVEGKSGSILDLLNGSFDFAGGKLKWDGKNFNIIADSFSLSSGQTINDIAEEKATKEINNFISSIYDPEIARLQAQIDGQIETWYYDYEPNLNNIPASNWKTETDKIKHEGDLFYWRTKGFAYRFFKDGNSWKWQMVQDTDITKALAQAATAQDTADNKRRVFVTTPTPPYDIGDLWVQGESGDIMRCCVGRQTGNYNISDWIKASKYTDDSGLNAFVNGEFKESISDLQSQADKKAETWYQSTDPSNKWTTDTLKSEHKGDLWYNTNEQKTYIYNGSKWELTKTTPPQEVFDVIDGKAQIFVTTPTPPYDIGDLWVQGESGDIMRCMKKRESGSYISVDWTKASKYVDNNAIKEAIEEQTQTDIFNKLTNNGALKGIYMQDNELYINATYLKSGYLLGDRIKGGILTLGGNNNTNGVLRILNASQKEIGHWDKDGIVATNCNISGDITANTLTANKSGTIAGWTFNDKAFYKNDINIGGKNGFYIGEDGISIGNYFVIDKNGLLVQDKNFKYTYDSRIEVNNNDFNSNTDIDNLEFQIILNNISLSDKIHLGIHYWYHHKDNTGEYSGMDIMTSDFYITVENTISITNPGNVMNVSSDFDAENHILEIRILGSEINKYGSDSSYKYGNNAFSRATSANTYYGGVLYNRAELKEIRVIRNGNIFKQYDGKILSKSGLTIDTVANVITGGNFKLNSDAFTSYSNFEFNIRRDFSDDENIFKVNKTMLFHKGLSMSSSGSNLIISNGFFYQKSSSSKRYKKNITFDIPSNLFPEKLYNLNIVSYKYKDNYLSSKDQRYGHNIIGLIAEDVYEKYPEACNLNEDGTPEMWDIHILFPAALKLIQDQHKELQVQKKKIKALNKKYQAQQKEIEELKAIKSQFQG